MYIINYFADKTKRKSRPPKWENGDFRWYKYMFIYNCIVNETAAFEWFWGDFLQLYLKYKKMHSGIVAQNLQLYRKY